MRKVLVSLVVVAVASALVASALAGRKSALTLVGTVGPGYTIKLTVNGQKAVRLKAGSYKFVLHDRASIHGWSLDGPHGFAKSPHPGAVRRHEDGDAHAQGGQVQVLLPVARVADVRPFHGRRVALSAVERPG